MILLVIVAAIIPVIAAANIPVIAAAIKQVIAVVDVPKSVRENVARLFADDQLMVNASITITFM